MDGFSVRWNSEHGSGIARGILPDGTHGPLIYPTRDEALEKASALSHGRDTSAHPPTIHYTVETYHNPRFRFLARPDGRQSSYARIIHGADGDGD